MENIKETEQYNLIPFVPNADFYYMKGIEFFQKKKLAQALKWMKKALERKPDDPLIQCQMAIIYIELNAYHAASELLHHVLEVSDYPDSYYLLANNYAHLGLFNEAKKYVEMYLERAPDGDFREDADQLLTILQDEADADWQLDGEDQLLIAQDYVFHEMEYLQWDEAVEALEEMLTLFPNSISGRHDYAEALFYTGKKKTAVEMERRMLEEQPNSLMSYANLALFYYELNEEKHENYINNLLRVYPMHEQQKLKIAVTLSRTGMHEEAYNRFRMLHKEKMKSHPSYYRWYAKAAFYNGKKEKAHAIWKEGCMEHPRLHSESYEWNSGL